MSPLTSLFGAIATPEYSMRTYLSTPLSSFSIVSAVVAARGRSLDLAGGRLTVRIPMIRRRAPEQDHAAPVSRPFREPSAAALVNTIGRLALPAASSRAPGRITKIPGFGWGLPLIVVPG